MSGKALTMEVRKWRDLRCMRVQACHHLDRCLF